MGEGRGETARYAVILILLLVAAFGSVHILRAVLRTRYPLMVVVSESMVPTLGVGDFILVGSIDDFDRVVAASMPEGDILVFVRPGDDEYIVHRAVGKSLGEDGWLFITQGDNNALPDGRPVEEERVMGKVVGRIPVLGFFPLFIKTLRGFVFVASIMAIVFFADYLMPVRGGGYVAGRFPWASLLLYPAVPAVFSLFLWAPGLRIELGLAAFAIWYAACLVSPLAFGDDDLCLMFWLYYFVLLMIPLGCDLVWIMTRITPSDWWIVEGSTIPLTWLLMTETPLFHRVFNELLKLLLPGCAIFLTTMAAKRRGIRTAVSVSRRLRGAPRLEA